MIAVMISVIIHATRAFWMGATGPLIQKTWWTVAAPTPQPEIEGR